MCSSDLSLQGLARRQVVAKVAEGVVARQRPFAKRRPQIRQLTRSCVVPRPPFRSLAASLANLVVFLPFVLLVGFLLWRSGRYEREVICEELEGEIGRSIAPEDIPAIRADGIFRTRRIDRMNPRASAAMDRADVDLVLVDRSDHFLVGDLARNEPFLRNRPVRQIGRAHV